MFEPMQRGVQRALLNLQNVVGNLYDALGDGPPVHGLERDRLQNQQVERALDKIGGFTQ
jgi:hypothetical protein